MSGKRPGVRTRIHLCPHCESVVSKVRIYDVIPAWSCSGCGRWAHWKTRLTIRNPENPKK